MSEKKKMNKRKDFTPNKGMDEERRKKRNIEKVGKIIF